MYQSVTIKIGSNVLAGGDGSLSRARMEHLVGQMASLHHAGRKIILVTSGAVAAGRGLITLPRKMDRVSQRQVLSSIGQVKLINEYASLFESHNIGIAQVLVTKQDFRTREHYLNMKNCLTQLWDNNIIPVINENDAVSVTALMFTDNDELSGLIATMMNCDALFILSNVDGIFNGNPNDGNSQVIREINVNDNLSDYISTVKSEFGRGGMLTKCRIAQKTAASGINVHIANGTRENVIANLFDGNGDFVNTRFEAGSHRPALKKWMAYSEGFAHAQIVVNDGAKEALFATKANSLLLPGVVEMTGEFKKGDLLLIKDGHDNTLGIGRSGMDRSKAEKHRHDKKYKPLVHYDYLFLYPENM
jgi:glutamate 5-kinase